MSFRTLAGARRLQTILALTLTVAAAACDDALAGPDPSMESMAGAYAASSGFGVLSLTTTEDGQTIDWLAAGADLRLQLEADGTVSGRLFIPDADEDGGDLDEDMAGTWTVMGNTVRFEQAADTFVRDMAFALTDGVLTGDQTFGDVRVRVVLVRS
jgi:hypothetical protein